MVWSFDTREPIAAKVDIAAGSIHLIAGDQTETVVTVNPANQSSKMDVEAAGKARVEFSGSVLSVVVPKPGGILSYVSFRDWGLVDVYRRLRPDTQAFSWWDYRAGNFHRNEGLRIDFVLTTEAIAARATAADIDREYRKKKDGLIASDHAPVIIDLV